MKQAGYPIVAAANPLRGLRQEAASVRSVLDSFIGPSSLARHLGRRRDLRTAGRRIHAAPWGPASTSRSPHSRFATDRAGLPHQGLVGLGRSHVPALTRK